MNGEAKDSSWRESSKASSITVAVRVRPFTEAERNNLVGNSGDEFFFGEGSLSNNKGSNSREGTNVYMPNAIRKIVDVVDDKMLIFDPPATNPLVQMQKNAFPNAKNTSRIREHRFVFDKLFDENASQQDIYNHSTKSLLEGVIDGYNATIFAYGATGCGKTHTILGTTEDPGVIFLTMKELYACIEKLSDTKIVDVSLSFLEIYNETIRDLLEPQTNFKKLVLREDANNKMTVSNLLSHRPKTVEDVMDLIIIGNNNRTSSPTEANSTSSRSHAVLQINVVKRNRTADVSEEHSFGTLSIIDLAGSERAAATKNRGARLNEGANINKSLLALGNCINALCDPRRRNHIPYRDSKLTRLLKFSLGGNCKTVMIVCISPLSQHYDETLNALKYADRAKEIKTKVVRNQQNLDRHVGSYLKMITEQKLEIEELRGRERKIVDRALNEEKEKQKVCNNSIIESFRSLQKTLDSKQQEKGLKYFILAKRKLLLLQRLEIENIVKVFSEMRKQSLAAEIEDLLNLSGQLISKITSRITSLEDQYTGASEIEYIFGDSIFHVYKRLKEQEHWTIESSTIFEALVNLMKESLERDILFNSSILFDHLIHELNGFDIISQGLAFFLKDKLHSKQEGSDATVSQAVEQITKLEQKIMNGEYEAQIDNLSSQFMLEKMHGSDTGKQELLLSTPSKQTTFLPKTRNNRRGVKPLLKNLLQREVKKNLTRKNSGRSLSQGKKVRWDVPNQESSDISVDESSAQNSLRSDPDDLSPLGHDVVDKSNIIDELDLKFNSALDSPSISAKSKDSTPGSYWNGISNKRLLANRDLGTHDEINTKLPLLNKKASTKVKSTMESSPELPFFPQNNQVDLAVPARSTLSLGAPTRVTNKTDQHI